MIYKNSVFVVQTFGNYNDCNRYFWSCVKLFRRTRYRVEKQFVRTEPLPC
jgi:hypothetical protein